MFQKMLEPELPFEVKLAPQKNQKEFGAFYTDLMLPISDIVVEYLNKKANFNSIVQASLALVNKALIRLSTAEAAAGPQFSAVFETVFKSVVNYHLEAA